MNRGKRRYQKPDTNPLFEEQLKSISEGCGNWSKLNRSYNESSIEQKAKNYLILTRIHNLNRSVHDGQVGNLKKIEQREKQKIVNPFDDQKLQPLAQSIATQKGKIDKPKRIYSKKLSKNCLLPSICPPKPNPQDQNLRIDLSQNLFQGEDLQISQDYNNNYVGNERLYYSIDLNRQMDQEQTSFGSLKNTNKSTNKTNSREFNNHFMRKRYSFSEEVASPPSPFVFKRERVSKESSRGNIDKVNYFKMPCISSKLVIQERKQSIIKRKFESSLKKEQELYKQGTFNRRQANRPTVLNSPQTILNIKQNDYSPWQQQDKSMNQSLLLLNDQQF